MFSTVLTAGLFVLMAGHVAEAQRSFYAGRFGMALGVHPRFTSTESNDLGNRGDENLSTTTEQFSTIDGTLYDQEYLRRIAQWPEDRQPFWFKNRGAISAMREQNVDAGNANTFGTRFGENLPSPFAAGSNRPVQQRTFRDDRPQSMHRYSNNFE